ncbi:MAG: DUF421 domain-containing protein [Clostridia bacterium]|nr:DUF421 domain-containing protein [Clostridia bacterium]
MFLIFLRVLIIYFTVLVFLRLMGKRQIGEMQPYELVITLIIADLATLPMSDTNIPLLNGILPLAILVLVHYVITFLTRKSIFFRRIISGKPVVVISPKGIEYQTLKDLNMNIDDLIESLRQCNYYNFDQVLYAIIETNGKMSVIPVSSVAPATAQDVKVNNPPAQLPHILISDGKLIKNELKQINLTEDELNKIIKHLNLKQKQLIILSIDESGKVYYQQKGQQYKVIEDYKKEVKL